MIAIGVDPGLTGGIAFVGPNTVFVYDMPTLPLPGTGLVRKRIDGRALTDLIRSNVPVGETCIPVLEAVRAMGGKNNAVQTQGSLMRTLGAIEAVFDVMRLKPYMVQPQSWKKFYRISKDKDAALEVARTLYPQLAGLERKKDHNRAEALLIAHFGLRRLS